MLPFTRKKTFSGTGVQTITGSFKGCQKRRQSEEEKEKNAQVDITQQRQQ